MQIKTTRPFWDLENPAEEPVAVDSSMTVTDERGAVLIGLDLAVEEASAGPVTEPAAIVAPASEPIASEAPEAQPAAETPAETAPPATPEDVLVLDHPAV